MRLNIDSNYESESVTFFKMEDSGAFDDELFSVFDNQSAGNTNSNENKEEDMTQKRSLLAKSSEKDHAIEELEATSRKKQKLEDADLE